MTERGSVLPLALFLTIGCAMVAILFADLAAVNLERQRAVTACDFSLLSAMRVRRDGIESIAHRWALFGGDITAPGGTLSVDPARWPAVASAAGSLRRAAPGFQGRVTSALTVALDANLVPRSAARMTSGTGLRLGLSAQTAPVLVGPAVATLPGAWFVRRWSASVAAPPLTDDAHLSIDWPLTWRGSAATTRVESAAVLEWDVDASAPVVLSRGRGGFARSYGETLDGALFDPHRYPVFRAARERES